MADAKISALTAITAPVATDELVVASGGTTKKIVPANLAKLMPGYQYDYVAITTNATSTQTVEASADTIITGNSVTFDGSTQVRVVFSANGMGNSTTAGTAITLWRKDGGAAAAQIARMSLWLGNASTAGVFVPVYGEYVDTPTAAATIYYIKMYVTGASTGTVLCTSPYRPAFMRVNRV
jgi:hypothetical protein